MTRRLNVNLEDLVEALEMNSYDLHYYLDLETGDVILVQGCYAREVDAFYDEAYRDQDAGSVRLADELEDWGLHDWQRQMMLEADRIYRGYGERYIRIERDDPHGAYDDMVRFIDTVHDPELRGRLRRAIHGRGAFRRFKDLLWHHPHLRQEWFDFQSARQRERAKAWLRARHIEPIPEGAPEEPTRPAEGEGPDVPDHRRDTEEPGLRAP